MIFETSWDDWHKDNVKLAGLLRKYDIPATFYLPIDGTDWEQAKWIKAMGFDIGCHTVTHPSDLKKLNAEHRWLEIVSAKEQLEAILGEEVTKFCYPRGRYDEDIVHMVKGAGFKEARTTIVLKTEVEDVFRKPTTIHFFPGRNEYNESDLVDLTKYYYDNCKDLYFHLWGHVFELNKYDLWDKLEYIFKYIND